MPFFAALQEAELRLAAFLSALDAWSAPVMAAFHSEQGLQSALAAMKKVVGTALMCPGGCRQLFTHKGYTPCEDIPAGVQAAARVYSALARGGCPGAEEQAAAAKRLVQELEGFGERVRQQHPS